MQSVDVLIIEVNVLIAEVHLYCTVGSILKDTKGIYVI